MIKELMIDGIKYSIRRPTIIIIDGEECVGSCNASMSQISISKRCGKGAEVVTLVHEIVHAILIGKNFSKENSNEELVDSLAMSIVNLIRLNPHLIKFIIDEGEIDYGDYTNLVRITMEEIENM